MSAGTILLLMGFTFVVSWYTAWAHGRYWTESRLVGGWLRLVVIAGVVLAALGFTWVYFTFLTALAVGTEFITLEDAQAMYGMGIPAIAGTLVGSGGAVGIHGRVLAYRRRIYGTSQPGAYANNPDLRGFWNAASNLTDVLTNVFDAIGYGRGSRAARASAPASSGSQRLFPDIKIDLDLGGSDGSSGGGGGDGGDGDGLSVLGFLVLVMLAILAIAGGMITTALIVRRADRIHASDIAAAFDPAP